jgi:hypothetical protein
MGERAGRPLLARDQRRGPVGPADLRPHPRREHDGRALLVDGVSRGLVALPELDPHVEVLPALRRFREAGDRHVAASHL